MLFALPEQCQGLTPSYKTAFIKILFLSKADIPAPALSFPAISHSRASRRDRFRWKIEGITAQLTPNQP